MRFGLLAFSLFTVLLPCQLSAKANDQNATGPEIIKLLSAGEQDAAESKLADLLKTNPDDQVSLYWAGVLLRSRFDVKAAGDYFRETIKRQPDSLEGLVSACVLGIDQARDREKAFSFYSALLILAKQNPDSIPTHWMAAVMSRTLTRDNVFQRSSVVRKKIILNGIREYETTLKLMEPGPGPVLIHQTLANLLGEVEDHSLAWKHREIAMKMSRASWCLQGAATTLLALGRDEEARDLMLEAVENGGRANCYSSLGTAYFELGQFDDAIKAWGKASEMEPDELSYLNACLTACVAKGDYPAARTYTKKALSENPQSRYYKIWDARLAAMLGEEGAGKRVLEAGAFNFDGSTTDLEAPTDPWFLAATTGDVAKIRELLKTTDVNKADKDKQTALMVASFSGWEEMAKVLIAAGANVDLVDSHANTAVHYSAQFVQPRVMALLLEAGAKINLQDAWKQTPLIMCVTRHNDEGFRMLIEKKADPNVETPHGGTPLHYAVGFGILEMVRTLIASGADINKKAIDSGYTPLVWACAEWQHSFVIEPLLAAGADINATDKKGETALFKSVNPLLNGPLVEMLLSKGANPALADKEGVAPIDKARMLGFEDLAKKMEGLAGKPSTFQFPEINSADPSLSVEEKDGCMYVAPILLAQGHATGKLSGFDKKDKGGAIKELREVFEIGNSKDLKSKISELVNAAGNSADLTSNINELESAGPKDQNTETATQTAVRKIQASASKNGLQQQAWNGAHVIYWADTGVTAGYLSPEEGRDLIKNASASVKKQFGTWQEFTDSFIAGAWANEAWEAGRYEQICQRILDAGIK